MVFFSDGNKSYNFNQISVATGLVLACVNIDLWSKLRKSISDRVAGQIVRWQDASGSGNSTHYSVDLHLRLQHDSLPALNLCMLHQISAAADDRPRC